MRLPARITNPVLGLLIEHSGYSSIEEFASAIVALGLQRHGLQLAYDHTTVKRWLAGGTCQYPDLVADVLARAWDVPIPVAVIWPQQRHGDPAAAAHLTPCVAPRTLDELAVYIGSDMLTRRQLLTSASRVALGPALTDPLLRWIAAPVVGLPPRTGPAPSRLTLHTVTGFEQATARLGAQDAAVGGGLSREAGVGQLKYAVDLLRDASYTETVGNRMLAAVAELAGMVGWMSHDVDMDGPAQRYFILGLKAACESADPRALLLRVSLLADMARQMAAMDQPSTGLRFVTAAIDLLPYGRHPAVAAMLWNLKARMLAPMGAGTVAETRHAIALAEDLLSQADGHDPEELSYTGVAELAGNAALALLDAATHAPDLAHHAEAQALRALAQRPDGYTRSRVFDHISLAAARFTLAEADQAAADGHTALDLAAEVATSGRVLDRLLTLDQRSARFARHPAVRDFRERLTATLTAAP